MYDSSTEPSTPAPTTTTIDSMKKIFASTYHVSPELLAFFLIFLLSALTYLDIANHEFVGYDDGRIILARVDVFDGITSKNIKNIILDDYPREEPLVVRDLSYLLNGSIFGAANPQGYLLGNLLLHMGASYLVFALSLVLFPKKYWQAILTAVLFAIHPVHVESVAWISSRKDTLYSCFFLAGLLTYSHHLKTNKILPLAASLGFYFLALFSKSAAMAFVPIALLFHCLLVPQKKWTKSEVLYFILLTTASCLFLRWYSKVLTDFGVFELQNSPSLLKVNPANWLVLNLEAITFYLGKLLYPATLSIIYDYPDPNVLYTNSPFLILSLATGTVLIFSLLKFITMADKRPLFLTLWFLVVLGPYLNWAGINIFVADRYLYLAAFAPIAGASYLLSSIIALVKRHNYSAGKLSVVLVCLLCAAMIVRGIEATRIWQDTTTLWNQVLKTSPAHVEPYIVLLDQDMSTYNQDQKSPKAKEALARAISIANQGYQIFCPNDRCPPQATGLLYYIAQIYYMKDNPIKAEQFVRQGLLLKPDDIRLNYLHSYLAIKRGDIQGAREDIEFIRSHANPREHAWILAKIIDTVEPLITEKIKTQITP